MTTTPTPVPTATELDRLCVDTIRMLYSPLYLAGYRLTLDDLRSFRQLGSRTPWDLGKAIGILASEPPLPPQRCTSDEHGH